MEQEAGDADKSATIAGNGQSKLADLATVCAGCGTASDPLARFCSHCGLPFVGEPTVQMEASTVLAEDSPPPTKRRRPWVIAATAIVVASVLVTGALIVSSRDSGPRFDLDAALAGSSNDVAEALAGLRRATSLVALRGAAAEAGRTATALDAVSQQLDDVRSADKRRAARSLLAAEAQVLRSFDRLEELPDDKLSDWDTVVLEVDGAITAVRALVPETARLDFDIEPARIADEAATVRVEVTRLVKTITDQLATWRAEVAAAEADKAAQSTALATYEAAARGHISRYGELRRSMAEFVTRIDNEGATYVEIYGFLGGAATGRQDIHAALSAVSPPPAMAAAHNGLLTVIDTSIDAVQAASEGVRQYQYGFLYYSYKTTPGWRSFRQKSDRISESYTTALAAWEARVKEEQAKIAAITAPSRPNV